MARDETFAIRKRERSGEKFEDNLAVHTGPNGGHAGKEKSEWAMLEWKA